MNRFRGCLDCCVSFVDGLSVELSVKNISGTPETQQLTVQSFFMRDFKDSLDLTTSSTSRFSFSDHTDIESLYLLSALSKSDREDVISILISLTFDCHLASCASPDLVTNSDICESKF